MIYEAYSVHDKAAVAFLAPIFTRTKGEAIRMFTSTVLEKDSQFGRHKGDYTLYEVGKWDDVAGVFLALDDPLRVISALEVGTGE